jgi:hypothetical protein
MDDLRKMPSVEWISVLECAGNGRAFFEPPVPGLQWTDGAVGNGRWRGVRLADVLQRAGVKDGAVEVLFDGADLPLGAMPDFQRSIPMKKALHRDTLLAYEMNGQPLPENHGFPLRVVVPGWAGDSWVKWVTSIRVLNEEWQGFWMKNAYRIPVRPVAPGATVPQEATVPVTSLAVKSVILQPANDTLKVGKPALLHGVAWSGDAGPVTHVDVSIDEGPWKPARLVGDKTRYGWRQWQYSWTPPMQDHTYSVRARAADASGRIQPITTDWNPSGYLWNGIRPIALTVGARPPSAVSQLRVQPPPAPPRFRETCLVCHEDDVIRQQPRLTQAQWERELDKMTNWGAQLRPEDRSALLDYLMNPARR